MARSRTVIKTRKHETQSLRAQLPPFTRKKCLKTKDKKAKNLYATEDRAKEAGEILHMRGEYQVIPYTGRGGCQGWHVTSNSNPYP